MTLHFTQHSVSKTLTLCIHTFEWLIYNEIKRNDIDFTVREAKRLMGLIAIHSKRHKPFSILKGLSRIQR